MIGPVLEITIQSSFQQALQQGAVLVRKIGFCIKYRAVLVQWLFAGDSGVEWHRVRRQRVIDLIKLTLVVARAVNIPMRADDKPLSQALNSMRTSRVK